MHMQAQQTGEHKLSCSTERNYPVTEPVRATALVRRLLLERVWRLLV
jgi:hypothetical protein